MSNEQARTFVLTIRADMSEPDMADVLRDLRAMWGVESIEPQRQPVRDAANKRPAPVMKKVVAND